MQEHKKGKERVIKVRWDQRNLDRINKWLGLKMDFTGFFYKGNNKIGYKTAGPALKYMYYHFPEYELNEECYGEM